MEIHRQQGRNPAIPFPAKRQAARANFHIHINVMVPQRCNHNSRMDFAAIHSLTHTITNSGQHRVHIKSHVHVSGWAKRQAQTIIGSSAAFYLAASQAIRAMCAGERKNG